jgi:hypothetical protein
VVRTVITVPVLLPDVPSQAAAKKMVPINAPVAHRGPTRIAWKRYPLVVPVRNLVAVRGFGLVYGAFQA